MDDAYAKILHELYMIVTTLPKKPIIVNIDYTDCEMELLAEQKSDLFHIDIELAQTPISLDLEMTLIVKEDMEEDPLPPSPPPKPPEGEFVPIIDETIPWFAQDYNYDEEYEDQYLIKKEWFTYESSP